MLITQTLEEVGVPRTDMGQRRMAAQAAAGGGRETGSAAQGMRRFVKQMMELWSGGFDSQRVLMTQV